ncbi:MAG: (d)CMP kinase [Chloroflexota bacterium]
MDNGRYLLKLAKHTILRAIHQLTEKRAPPLLIAIDGGSGSGKSTLAEMIAQELDAALVPSDDFYAAHIPTTVCL